MWQGAQHEQRGRLGASREGRREEDPAGPAPYEEAAHYLQKDTQLLLPAGRAMEADRASAYGGFLLTLIGPRNHKLNSALRFWKQEPEQRRCK